MSRWTQLGVAPIPNSDEELRLLQRHEEFSIRLGGIKGELMNSRVHGSEEALAELGCGAIADPEDARVLVGGLGMGFTLASALSAVGPAAEVVVAELIAEVVEWNRGPLGECAGRPLDDNRTQVHVGDVAQLVQDELATFDAILLDVDNGPEGLTHDDNQWLYTEQGLEVLYQRLKPEGMLAVWSAGPDPMFVIRLKKAGFRVEIRTVRARPGKGSRHTIFLAQKPWRPRSRKSGSE